MLTTITHPHSDPTSGGGSACYLTSPSPPPTPLHDSDNIEPSISPAAASQPVIPVVRTGRPVRVSSSVNPRVLSHLRRKFAEQTIMTRCEALLSTEGFEADCNSVKNCKSDISRPATRGLCRTSSFKGLKTKFNRVGSDGAKGYDPLPAYSDDLWFPREKITSVNRALHGKSSSLKVSPRPYRPMSLIPATNRIVLADSSDESEGESSLDFAMYNSRKTEADVSLGG